MNPPKGHVNEQSRGPVECGPVSCSLRVAQLSDEAEDALRGANSLQLAEALITPRTSLQPPNATRGNMYLHWSQRTSGDGAGPYSAALFERLQMPAIAPP